LLNPPEKLPWSRRFILGQPQALSGELKFLDHQLPSENGVLEVLQTPGHCDDELAFYDPKTKVLLAGDSFMGAYFSTPNPEVDSNRWIASLQRVLELDIEILVEAHGQMHTLRPDIPDIPGVVLRQDPRKQLQEKLSNLIWLREQVQDGLAEQMPIRAVEASCFPWVKSRNWESFLNDEVVRMLTSGDFCRTQMINSFRRNSDTSEVWPQVNKVQFICEKKS
jgi:glyoxylase-like metal-dependent hydrolase (beta-lactamase superfamily II)